MDQKQIIMLTFSALMLFKVYKVFNYIRRNKLVKEFYKNKVVLITGASAGLGAALAEQLYKLNCRVILCSRREDELNKVKENLVQSTKRPLKEPHVLVLDVTEPIEQIKEKLELIVEKYGCIDVLFNNAGISSRGEARLTTDEVFHKVMDVNFFGPIKLSRLILNYMIDKNNKNVDKKFSHKYAIANIGSVSSLISAPYRSAYSASKFALSAYTDALRAELYNHNNIHILNAYPGYINTSILMSALKENGQTISQNDDSHEQGYSAEYVANQVIEALAEDKKEIVITVLAHRIFIGIRFLFPNLYHFIAQKIAKKTYLNRYG